MSDRRVTGLFAAMAYLPMLLTSPGQVSADTKTYLTLDPGGVLASAATMWDPSTGAGTVPHQNIGYLFPLGPYYWLLDRIGVPDWIAQRLLWGTLAFAAALGAYRLARWLGWHANAALVVGVAYGFTPYVLSYLARLSAILGPWAAMPWMILLAAQAARTRSWRPAAWFALVVALVGSVNATSLVFAGLAPVLWLLLDVLSGRAPWAGAARAAAKIGVLSAGVSAWWIAGLSVQGAFGLPILRYTETYQAVASASTPPEVLRGLGYWFFYGGDRLGSWVGPAEPYIDHPALILLGFAITTISLLGICTPFPGRASAALLLLVGLAVSVGAAPRDSSSWYGSLFESFATDTTTGAALRSTPRAAPLVVLALALGLGAAAHWRGGRLSAHGPLAAAPTVAAVGLVMLQLFPWFTGGAATASLLRDEQLPVYERELARWLDATGDGRVYALPGSDFANYRWGGTVDPVLPGLVDRPVLYRELVPQGGDGTADLLNAFERRMAEGWFEPESLAPIAELLDVDTVVMRNDLEHERYRLARPGALWTDVSGVLGTPDHVGPLVTDQPTIPYVDEPLLARSDAASEFPVVAAFDTDRPATSGPISIVAADAPLIVAGSGDGLVDLAGAGLLDVDRPVLYLGTLDDAASVLADAAVGDDAHWIVTDSNRKQGRHWSTIGSNLGALETEGPLVLDTDAGDSRLEPFPTDVNGQTIALHLGDVSEVRASYSGNKIAYTPEDAPFFAVDGDPSTAWRAGVFDEAVGLVWEMDLSEPSSAGQVTLLQPVTGVVDRFITSARLTLDGSRSVDVTLDDSSRTEPGQTVRLPGDEPFSTLRIEVLADNLGPLASFAGRPGVGFAEVGIAGVSDDRVVRLPIVSESSTFVDRAGVSPRVSYVMTRQRIDPATPNRSAPEPRLRREFDVPRDATFALGGEARRSSTITDAAWSDLTPGQPTPIVADRRLPGSFDSRGASAFDGDISTAWQTPFDASVGATVTVRAPISSSQVAVTWRTGDRYSTPTRFTLSGDDTTMTLSDPDIVDLGDVVMATYDLGAYEASTTTLTIDAIAPTTSAEYFSGVEQTLPVAIAEIDFGDTTLRDAVDAAATIDDQCRFDLLELDGVPLGVRLEASAASTDRSEIAVRACDGLIELDAGTHRIDTAAGAATGFDIDRLTLLADDVAQERTQAATATTAPPTQPAVTVMASGSTQHDVVIGPSSQASWLTLDQSWNAGWKASLNGADLGPPTLINGYANGWLVPAADSTRNVSLEWTPQRSVDIGLLLSAAFGAIIIALLALLPRRTDRDAVSPLVRIAGQPSIGASRSMAVGVVVCILAVGGPVAAVAGIASLSLTERRRWMQPALVVAALSVLAVGIAGLEWRRDYPIGPDWPSQFGWATPLAWAAVAVVVVPALCRPLSMVRSSCEP